MTEDTGTFIFWHALKQSKADALRSEAIRIFPINKWIVHLTLSPIFIALAFFSTFLLSIFFTLFLFGGVILGLWIEWLCQKLVKYNQVRSLEGEYVAIKEILIVETKIDKESDK